MTAARIHSRGWMRQLRDGLPDREVTTLIGCTAALIAGLTLWLIAGDRAVTIATAAIVLWLLYDRVQLLDRCDDAIDTADRALAKETAMPAHAAEPEDTDEFPAITQPQARVLVEQWADGIVEAEVTATTVEREVGGYKFTFREV